MVAEPRLCTVAPSSESITRLNLTNYAHSSKSQLSYFGFKLGVFNNDRIAWSSTLYPC